MNFELKGMKEALKNLDLIREDMSDDNLRADALLAVEPIAEDARMLAPVGEGALRDSIRATVFEDGSVGVVIENWKGHFFEFGTVQMRAQPMLGPAVAANEDRVLDSFAGMVRARIEQQPGTNKSRVAVKFEGM